MCRDTEVDRPVRVGPRPARLSSTPRSRTAITDSRCKRSFDRFWEGVSIRQGSPPGAILSKTSGTPPQALPATLLTESHICELPLPRRLTHVYVGRPRSMHGTPHSGDAVPDAFVHLLRHDMRQLISYPARRNSPTVDPPLGCQKFTSTTWGRAARNRYQSKSVTPTKKRISTRLLRSGGWRPSRSRWGAL